MEKKTFEQERKTIEVITFEPNESEYPFAIVKESVINEERTTTTFEIVLGNTKVSEKSFTHLEIARDYIKSKPYDLIIALIYQTTFLKEQYENEQQELLKHKENETK